MEIKTLQFIEKALEKAVYNFDNDAKQWTGWVKGFPGVYSQQKNVEEVRAEMAEMLEEYLFASFQEKRKVPGFSLNINIYAPKTC